MLCAQQVSVKARKDSPSAKKAPVVYIVRLGVAMVSRRQSVPCAYCIDESVQSTSVCRGKDRKVNEQAQSTPRVEDEGHAQGIKKVDGQTDD